MNDKTLVILPGWGHHRGMWRQVAEMFHDMDVVVYDLPGFGSEPLIGAGWGVPEYADWVRSKITDDQLQNVILLGHSFGGRIAAYIAAESLSWLTKLILYGAPCIYRPSLKVKILSTLARWGKPLGLHAPARLNGERSTAEARGMGEIFRRVVDFDETVQLTRMRVPTLLVWGSDDREVPLRLAREMQTLIPGSFLTILDHTGHNAHLDNPFLFYGTIQSFL